MGVEVRRPWQDCLAANKTRWKERAMKGERLSRGKVWTCIKRHKGKTCALNTWSCSKRCSDKIVCQVYECCSHVYNIHKSTSLQHLDLKGFIFPRYGIWCYLHFFMLLVAERKR